MEGPTADNPEPPRPERPSLLRRNREAAANDGPTMPLPAGPPAAERAASLRAMFPTHTNPSGPVDIDTRPTDPFSIPTGTAPSGIPTGTTPPSIPTGGDGAADLPVPVQPSRRSFRRIATVLAVFLLGALLGVGTLLLLDDPDPDPDRVAAQPGASAGNTTAPSAPPTASAPVSGGASPPTAAAPTPTGARPSPTSEAARVSGRLNPSRANLALRRLSAASSAERGDLGSFAAFDGDTETRWGSGFSDPQWISVDLGDTWHVSEVRLLWERAYATQYHVDVSLDGRRWTTVYATGAGGGGAVDIDGLSVTARYVRMYATQRSGQYGDSLFEFEVR